MHRDARQLDGPDRFVACRPMHDPQRRLPLLWVIAAPEWQPTAGRDRAPRRASQSHRAAGARARRLQARAIGPCLRAPPGPRARAAPRRTCRRARSRATPRSATVLKTSRWSSGTSTTISGSPWFAIAIDWLAGGDDLADFEAHGSSPHRCSRRAAPCTSPGCAPVRACAPRPRPPRAPSAQVLCACSSSDSLTEPSLFSACMRLPVRVGLPRSARSPLRAAGGRFLGESVVDVIEHGEHVAFAHSLADVDAPLERPCRRRETPDPLRAAPARTPK